MIIYYIYIRYDTLYIVVVVYVVTVFLEMRKIQTCIMLDPSIKQQVDLRGMNLSEFVGACLEDVFVSSAADELVKRAEDFEAKALGLRAQAKILLSDEKKAREKAGLAESILEKLKESYLETFLRSDGRMNDSEWASRPKIVAYLRELRRSKVDVCMELHKWAQKEAKKHEKEA